MKIHRTQRGFIIDFDKQYYLSKHTNWEAFINRQDLFFSLARETEALESDFSLFSAIRANSLPPIGNQPVWGCWSEDEQAELSFFYKGNSEVAVGSTASIKAQAKGDTHVLSVCLAFFVSKFGQIVGVTMAHDVMNQSIYHRSKSALGFAKNYDSSLGLGSSLLIFDQALPSFFQVRIEHFREDTCIQVVHKEIGINTFELMQNIRKIRENRTFTAGFYYLTQPLSLDFTCRALEMGDQIQTTTLGLGTLKNTYIR